jgi:hypothetical protein
MRPHLTVEQRQLALRLKARGLSRREISPRVGCSHQGVALVVRQASGPRGGSRTLAGCQPMTCGCLCSWCLPGP